MLLSASSSWASRWQRFRHPWLMPTCHPHAKMPSHCRNAGQDQEEEEGARVWLQQAGRVRTPPGRGGSAGAEEASGPAWRPRGLQSHPSFCALHSQWAGPPSGSKRTECPDPQLPALRLGTSGSGLFIRPPQLSVSCGRAAFMAGIVHGGRRSWRASSFFVFSSHGCGSVLCPRRLGLNCSRREGAGPSAEMTHPLLPLLPCCRAVWGPRRQRQRWI